MVEVFRADCGGVADAFDLLGGILGGGDAALGGVFGSLRGVVGEVFGGLGQLVEGGRAGVHESCGWVWGVIVAQYAVGAVGAMG